MARKTGNEMKYLEGNHIAPTVAKEHVGRKVQYLLSRDIDKTGRGYFFPRTGVITDVFCKQIDFGNGDYITYKQCREIVLLETEDTK
jgi:hypothetical protein